MELIILINVASDMKLADDHQNGGTKFSIFFCVYFCILDKFDLCTEKGILLKTNSLAPATNGLQVLKDKETYYVVLLDGKLKTRNRCIYYL